MTVPQTRSSTVLEDSLANVLQRIDSSFLDTVELSFVVAHDSDLRCMDWQQLERVLLALHFFSMRRVCVFFNIMEGAEQRWVWKAIESMICEAMPDLYRRDVLKICETKQRKSGQGSYLVLINTNLLNVHA